MNKERTKDLLGIAAEECSEVAQRLSKCERFTLTEVQPGQELTNAERVQEEVCDLLTMLGVIENECGVVLIPDLTPRMVQHSLNKIAKVEKCFKLSKKLWSEL